MEKTVVVITGPNQGIGFHLTRSLVYSGRYRVAGLDLSGEYLTAGESQPEALRFYRCDVTDRAAVEATV